ncbi:hypothetical protein OG852_25260 [Streptomyces sp. NBC_00582]|nr:hypothetical protein [Streptomyces sp. NBC_00582]WUB68038.1 hypothetical protein OG852_25260 [Streptomyces sp. NBC_00582]
MAVIVSNLAVAGIAAFGVWQLDGDRSVIVGVLTAAFTAVSSTTTAYLGIKAVSNTAKSIALAEPQRRAEAAALAAAAATATSTPAPAPAAPAAATPTVSSADTSPPSPPAQRGS